MSIKRKEKEIQKKRNIKSRKIDKRKRKMLVLTHIITFSITSYMTIKAVTNQSHMSLSLSYDTKKVIKDSKTIILYYIFTIC